MAYFTPDFQTIEVKSELSEDLEIENKEEELRELLTSWDLDLLADHFVDQEIFVDVLQVIKRHHLEKLLKRYSFGTQIKFEHHLEKWRDSIGCTLEEPTPQKVETEIPQPSRNVIKRTSPMVIQSVRSAPYSVPPPAPSTQPAAVTSSDITVNEILNKTAKGALIMDVYKKQGKFTEELRSMLIEVVACYFSDQQIQLNLPSSYRLENEIIEKFPTEKLEYYRTSKRGRLYNKFCNIKFSYKSISTGLSVVQRKIQNDIEKSSVIAFVPETNAEEYAQRIKDEVGLTEEQFDKYWLACTRYRLNEIQNLKSITEILERWPHYRSAHGLRLIAMDFSFFSGISGSLSDCWDKYFPNVFEFLRSMNRVKERQVRSFLETIDSPDIDENHKNILLLWSLHGYLVPTHKTVVKDDAGKSSIVKFTIKDSQKAFLFIARNHQEIEEHLAILAEKSKPIQPLIIAVGEDIQSLLEFYVYFEGTKLPVDNVVHALDICFKIYHLFNMPFQQACPAVWTFIQQFFYNIKSKNNFTKVQIMIEELKCLN